MEHVRTKHGDFRLTYPEPEGMPTFNDPARVCEALVEVARGHAVLFTPLADGRFAVDISHGSTARDQATRDGFDGAEWGIGPSTRQALRFALGAHFGGDYPDTEYVTPETGGN